MKTNIVRIALFLMLTPLVASAQGFRDLDNALAAVSRGFERGDSSAIVAGIMDGDRVELQFPQLIEKSGFFGRDQAAYLLDELFRRTSPSGFVQARARKISAQNQYYITGNWTIEVNGQKETREVYITLQNKDGNWTVVSIRSAGS